MIKNPKNGAEVIKQIKEQAFRAILTIVLICAATSALYADSRDTILLFRMKNASQYEGAWHLESELSAMLKDRLSMHYRVVEKSLLTEFGYSGNDEIYNSKKKMLSVAEEYGAKLIINGLIERFDVSTHGAYTPDVGGAKYYQGRVELNVELIKTDDKSSKRFMIKGVTHGADIGITLFGGPGGYDDQAGISLMDRMQKVRFGSEVFRESLLGRAVIETSDRLLTNVIKLLPVSKAKSLDGKVLHVEGENVYVNVGTDHEVTEGTRFLVYAEGEEIRDEESGELLGRTENDIAEIELVFVKAAAFSKAKIIKMYADEFPENAKIRLIKEQNN